MVDVAYVTRETSELFLGVLALILVFSSLTLLTFLRFFFSPEHAGHML